MNEIRLELTSALLLIIFRTENAFPDSRCSANFAFKFSKNPNFDFLVELLLSLFEDDWSNNYCGRMLYCPLVIVSQQQVK